MRKTGTLFLAAFIWLAGCASHGHKRDVRPEGDLLVYEVNLNDRSDDLFKVKLQVDDLTAENAVYQFAATAPGTYQVMDIGRFVREFEAYDATGAEIQVEQVATNQWRITKPEDVSEIRYTVAETWDTPVDSNLIYPMAGTSIEADHVQINGHCVFGYPSGMQMRPLQIRFDYPEEWLVGTALLRDRAGNYYADNYDHIVDSPVLMGRLSRADLKVNGSKVEIYTYSKTDKIKSDLILDSVKDILLAAAKFMDGLPVERYTFLFHFEDVTYGAWEHSYSSTYAYSEANFESLLQNSIPSVVAHEFYHVVTPLNIHSEVIDQFNFVAPSPSEHLWLYEGVTEWAAHIMQLRSGLIGLDDYLYVLRTKMNVNDNFRQDYSLRDLALNSYTREGQKQYANIYMRGAVVAGLLDILLLDLSDGKRGLREVINELSEIYGPQRAFPENAFYDEFTRLTYPQVADFFEAYVKNANPLPLADYYGKLGIAYWQEIPSGEQEPTAGFAITVDGGRIALAQVSREAQAFGLRAGDLIAAYDGMEVSLKNAQSVFADFQHLEAGVPYELTVERNGQQHTYTCEKIMKERIDRHVFAADSSATPEQLALRAAWMKNL